MTVPSRPYHGPDAIGQRWAGIASTWSQAKIEAKIPGVGDFVRVFENDRPLPVHDALHEIYREAYGPRWPFKTIVAVRLELRDSDGSALADEEITVAPAENNSFDLFFSDKSTISAYAFKPGTIEGDAPTTRAADRASPARDSGISLLEPITADEYGAVEVVIGLLQQMVDAADLDQPQQWKVQSALELLIDTHREAVVGETRRHELWAVTKRVMRYIYKELPVDLTKWAAAVGVVTKVWPMLGDFLRSL